MPKSKRRKSPEEIADDCIEGLSTVLEHAGILSSNDNDDDDNDNGDVDDHDVDPWNRLSTNLKELMVSSGQLSNLGNHEFAKRNDLLLQMEATIHQARRQTVPSVFAFLKKSTLIQLESCQALQAITRSNPQLLLSSRLLPLAKALEAAIRRQKLAWLQTQMLMEDAMNDIYHHSSDTSILQLIYKRINRRCIHPDRSPWREALGLLESIAGGVVVLRSNDVVDCQDATFMDPPPAKPHDAAPNLRIDTSICATLQLPLIIKEFFTTPSARVLSVLVVGPEGSGKSHLLAHLQKHALDLEIQVLHPNLAFDAIGSTVGAAEDILISIMTYAKTQDGNCLLLLDDLDSVCGKVEQHSVTTRESGQQEPHSRARLRHLFFALLDVIQRNYGNSSRGKMMLIASSKENYKAMDRFDTILPLLPPNKEERTKIIRNYINSNAIETFVDYTLGLSRAEIAHHCREAALAAINSRSDFLTCLKEKLQSSTPESLKNGVNADFVDITVLSARDLQLKYPIRNTQNAINDLPLFGQNAIDAWEDLRRLIVLPVCQSSEIDKLLYYRGGNSSKKAFCGGVLLASAPGTGKSTISEFCASVAASIDPQVKLLDVSCTSLIHKEVGGSERALHKLFVSARAAAPCIVVLDGIETIAQVRGNDNTTEGTMDRLLSTLLTELDGVDYNSSGGSTMAIIGITHDPEWIDPALRRPGRLERTIWLGNPDLGGRQRIVEGELANAAYDSNGQEEFPTKSQLAAKVASLTEGYTGAELIAICNDSKIKALEHYLNNDDNENKNSFITPQLVLDATNSKN
mmetsp:Transcript_10799/g.27341  ORF Transcript_10799/g.27341 Transcript_10799/m.27341 type:complete len:802 (-) Transcript_10799:1053-3458(-)